MPVRPGLPEDLNKRGWFLQGDDEALFMYLCWVLVESVQILSQGITTVVSASDAVRVEHWHKLENKKSAQGHCPWIRGPKQKGKQAVEQVAGRGFPGMNTGADEHHLSTETRQLNWAEPWTSKPMGAATRLAQDQAMSPRAFTMQC